MTVWPIYLGEGETHDGVDRLPPPPNWRAVEQPEQEPLPVPSIPGNHFQGRLGDRPTARHASKRVVDMVNAALFLRRPLLVTGPPGSGKSTLAYDVAFELGLGPVLRWAISSRATLQGGLYLYDALGRLRDENIRHLREQSRRADAAGASALDASVEEPLPIGRHVKLGPLGTALLAFERPRVLLIDEIDKGDLDLPNDLLDVLEEGTFEIPELARIGDEESTVEVRTNDIDGRANISLGRVWVQKFPLVVLTSNGDRDFSPAFLRRCLRLDLDFMTPAELAQLVAAQLGPEVLANAEGAISQFVLLRKDGLLAADQLLNALYLTVTGMGPWGEHGALDPDVVEATLKSLLSRDSLGT